jgi:hypothetical protein
MTRNRYAKRRDKNEPAIVKALRAAGANVAITDHPFDLVVSGIAQDGVRRMAHMEVKNPDTAYGKKGLNPLQLEWAEKVERLFVVDTPEVAVACYLEMLK